MDREAADRFLPGMLFEPALRYSKFWVLSDFAAGVKNRTELGSFLNRSSSGHSFFLPYGTRRARSSNDSAKGLWRGTWFTGNDVRNAFLKLARRSRSWSSFAYSLRRPFMI